LRAPSGWRRPRVDAPRQDLLIQELAQIRQLRPLERGKERGRSVESDAGTVGTSVVVKADKERHVEASANVDAQDPRCDDRVADQVRRAPGGAAGQGHARPLIDLPQNHQSVGSGDALDLAFHLAPGCLTLDQRHTGAGIPSAELALEGGNEGWISGAKSTAARG
jgi:hypothetical protein